MWLLLSISITSLLLVFSLWQFQLLIVLSTPLYQNHHSIWLQQLGAPFTWSFPSTFFRDWGSSPHPSVHGSLFRAGSLLALGLFFSSHLWCPFYFHLVTYSAHFRFPRAPTMVPFVVPKFATPAFSDPFRLIRSRPPRLPIETLLRCLYLLQRLADLACSD